MGEKPLNPPWTCEKCGGHWESRELPWIEGQTYHTPVPPVGHCPSCRRKESDVFFAEQEQRRLLQVRDTFLRWSQIGERYLDCAFATFERRTGTEDALAAAQRFAADFRPGNGRWLLLSGPPGNGKTHLAMAIRGAVEASTNCQALAITQPYFLAKIRATWDHKSNDADLDQHSENWILDRLAGAGLVVWDDLMSWDDWAYDRIFVILDGRYRNDRPTVFTSNHPLQAIERFMGARLWSRFAAKTEMVRITASDFRLERERDPS